MPNQNNSNNQQNQDKKYKDYVEQISPKPPYIKNYIMAFIVGGIICMIGQGINDSYMNFAGLGVYDLIGKRAGAGSIIPITGFANSIVSPAMEFKREGYVLGVGANLFKIAGPVLVYGIGSSILFGLVYYIVQIIFK